MRILIKRVYDDPGDDDGLRVLVDRLWPRGLKKAEVRIDLWAKDLAPTARLREWFGHEASRFGEFRSRYLAELDARRDAARELRERAAGETLTLLYVARDRTCNHALVLRDFILKD